MSKRSFIAFGDRVISFPISEKPIAILGQLEPIEITGVMDICQVLTPEEVEAYKLLHE